MKINCGGLITNEFNDVLLWQEADERWQCPGGALVSGGQLPAARLAELVEAQTGLRVLPIRLVGLYTTAGDTLTLMFRCLQKGGTRQETQARFFQLGHLPPTLDEQQGYMLTQASKHPGGTPHWADLRPAHTAGSFTALRTLWHKLQGAPAMAETTALSPAWEIEVLVMITTAGGDVVVLADGDLIALPGGSVKEAEAPWAAAVRLAQTLAKQAITPQGLSSIYVAPDEPRLTLVFTAVVPDVPSNTATFPLNQLPQTLPPLHQQALADYVSQERETIFRQQQ
ncbi:MAG: hypothetical protein KDD89_06575 [Anaerolineales bacterium]|nr:hypothetical protein [Anaerolineales bacterium]